MSHSQVVVSARVTCARRLGLNVHRGFRGPAAGAGVFSGQ